MNASAPPTKPPLSTKQLALLNDVWFIFGNGGSRHTKEGHEFLRLLIQTGEDKRKEIKPNKGVVNAVNQIEQLPKLLIETEHKLRFRTHKPCEKCGTRTPFTVDVMGREAHWCGCP